MSKSYNNTIPVFEAEKPLRKKIMSIITDSTPVEAPKDPAVSTIVEFYRLVAGPEAVSAMEESFRAGGTGYGAYKEQLFDAIWEFFRPARTRRAELEADPGYVDKVLTEGARKARSLAGAVLARVRHACGL
jgi:tryptophanyl-tRNA synthetase